MNELEALWAEKLTAAIENAKASGRDDVAGYLELKAANDAVRQTGVQWLFDSLIELAAEANRRMTNIAIERDDPFSFSYRGANMVGSRLSIRHGVRCLTAEAGWTRTPADGFMRSGAMAAARITHFGMPKAGAELLLVRADGKPQWSVSADGRPGVMFTSKHLQEHFSLFLG
jgi:hypothetical protein